MAGQRRILPQPFHVLATQNPIEQEGTYPLPEAQLDRFLLQIDVGYPERDDERQIILATTGVDEAVAEPVFDAESLIAAQRLIRRLPVGEAVVERILDLVRAARPGTPDAHPAVRTAVSWGPGPRAAQALMLAIRARALIQGRLVPGLDDVAALAHPVLIHRMALGFAARAEGQTLDDADRRGWSATSWGWRPPREPGQPRLRGRHKPQGPVGLRRDAEKVGGGAAAAAGAGRASGGERVDGLPRPAAGRARRELLAVPPGGAGRPALDGRLAAVGQVGPAVHPRDGVGGGADRLDLGRRRAVDGLPRLRRDDFKARSKFERAALLALAVSVLLIKAGERVALMGTDAAQPRAGRAQLNRMALALGSERGDDGGPTTACRRATG